MDLEILKIKFFLHLQILLQNNKKGVTVFDYVVIIID